MEGVRYKRRHAIGFLLYEEGPRNPGTFKWKIVYYPYMFKLQSPSKYSPFDAIHLLRLFPTAQNSFWTCWFWCLLVLLLFFVSPLPHQQKYFPLRTFFIQGNIKKLIRERSGKLGGWGTGSCHFWSKTAEYLMQFYILGVLVNTWCSCKSPIMKWTKTHWKS